MREDSISLYVKPLNGHKMAITSL